MKFDVPPGTAPSKCSSCSALIFWIKTRTGKNMPVDVATHESHFATCPNADEHRGNPRQPSLFVGVADGGRKA
jgi:hypothetical protein